jgi:hypothetical protein
MRILAIRASRHHFLPISCIIALGALSGPLLAWTPGIATPEAIGSPAQPLTVNTADRNDVLSFYQCVFKASEGYAAKLNWTGNVSACAAGTTGAAFKDDVRRRINWFRAMAGIPADIVFDTAFNTNAQAAALIMVEHGNLSHTPGATFGMTGCWTAAGETGANKGNLALGSYGPQSIIQYMEDEGGGNTTVGHRRWILYPNITKMGTGDIPEVGSYPYGPGEHYDGNCLYVIDSASNRATSGGFVSWPPPGFVPSEHLYPRWSLQYNSAIFGTPTFGSASVSMTVAATGAGIPVSITSRYTGGGTTGDPALVWTPNWSSFGGSPPLETRLQITVSGITVGASGAPTTHTYYVTPINPNAVADPLTVSGTTTPPTSGAAYTFPPLTGVGAESYEVGVAPVVAANFTEGAEDNPAPKIVDGTSASYDLRPNLTPLYGSPGAQSGSRAFHLTIPDFDDPLQSFEIDRNLIPTATSELQFYDLFRFSTTGSRLSAQVSTDGGGSWTEVWGKNGNGADSTTGWVKVWGYHGISLASYAGRVVRIRFTYTYSGSIFTGTAPEDGVYVDGATVTGAQSLGAETISPLAGSASGFTLNTATAGSPLVVGQEYFLRVRPILGCHTFGFGSHLAVTAQAPPAGFASWMATQYPSITRNGFGDNPDGDTLTNGAEYAFGGNPGVPDTVAPGLGSGTTGAYSLGFDTASLPYVPNGISYEARSSTDLATWKPLTDTGTGTMHNFTVPSAETRQFVRWVITLAP